ncbi:hypothetical protein PHLGIDRAFT_17377, partial [Phlebiopsis gigantea 11061_1 CR5-6]
PQSNWAQLLRVAEFALNSCVHSAHNCSLFKVVYGYQPNFTILAGDVATCQLPTRNSRDFAHSRKNAEAALRTSKANMSPRGPPPIGFSIGNKKGNNVNGVLPPPPKPVTVDKKEEYKVNKIPASRMYQHQLQYLIRWNGYGAGSNFWESAKNVCHAKAAVNRFHKKHPNAVWCINAALFQFLPRQAVENLTHTDAPAFAWEVGWFLTGGPWQTIDFAGGNAAAQLVV